MRASDFNFAKDIRFDINTGVTTFKDTRLVIVDANAIGLLRQNLISELGWKQARTFFLKFGYQNGFSDFLQIKTNYKFKDEMELLASGPVIHTWEGIVHAQPTHIEFNRDTGDFLFTGIWSNSYEAQQHISYNEADSEPACWSLMGYASGWCTAFFGSPLVAIEPLCKGMGHDHCEWKIQPPEAWGDEALPYLEAYQEFFKEMR